MLEESQKSGLSHDFTNLVTTKLNFTSLTQMTDKDDLLVIRCPPGVKLPGFPHPCQNLLFSI